MKFNYRRIPQSGLALIMAFSLLSEANFTPAVAGSGVDVYVVFAGKDKKDKTALKQAFSSDLKVKFYNVDLLALADYSGKQKALAKFERSKIIVFVKDSPHELLEGSTVKIDLVIFNSTGKGVQSESMTLYVVGKGTNLSALGDIKTHGAATESDLRNASALQASDAVVVDSGLDIHKAVAQIVATILGS